MSRENVEIVRRWVQAWDWKDLSTWLGFLDRDISWVPTPQHPEETSIRGHEQTLVFLHEWIEPWDSYTVRLDEIIDANDDGVVVVLRHFGQQSESGLEIDMSLPGIITLRRGKIIEARWFLERRDALEAAGVRE
jgi:ketosteroid isomerase-like protein